MFSRPLPYTETVKLLRLLLLAASIASIPVACASGEEDVGNGGQAPADAGIDKSNTACTPGKQELCLCLGGEQGVQTCRDDGSGFDACECVGLGGSGGGSAGSGGASGAAGIAAVPSAHANHDPTGGDGDDGGPDDCG